MLSILDSLGSVSRLTPSTMALLEAFPRLVLTQMNPQQFDQIYTYQSFKIISSVSAVSNGKISLSTPLTDEEALAGVRSSSISLSTVSGISHVKVSILVTRLQSLSSALFPLVHSNPMRIFLPDLSVCASSGCGFTVVTAYVDNSTYFNGTYEGGTYSNSTYHAYPYPLTIL